MWKIDADKEDVEHLRSVKRSGENAEVDKTIKMNWETVM